jgi:hypothetical protein
MHSTQYKPALALNTAILFLVFNRPETTVKVFETIRKARPRRLYIAADGPREKRQGEAEAVAKVREIATAVDWPCEVKTLFRKHNLGCKYAVSGAIDWFFSQEECGIILEDDIVPNQGFFEYCQSALEQYRNDPRVGMVTGHSIDGAHKSSIHQYSTKFSIYGLIWGWATWRHVWNEYDVELVEWAPEKIDFLLRQKSSNSLYVDMWRKIFSDVQCGKINSWDYQLNYILLKKNLFCVMPPHNLIDNIGFNQDATHTIGDPPDWLIDSSPIVPEHVIFSKPKVDVQLDRAIASKIFGITAWARAKHFIKKLIRH